MKDRRTFVTDAALSVLGAALPARVALAGNAGPPTYVEYLSASAVPKAAIDQFLKGPDWAQFDPDVGYILGNSLQHDGIDRSSTISTVQRNGARTGFMYRDRKARINTYGNSFTQGHQVSDGETWQEYLAAHIGEPINNFGMGGHGVYQAYRRMVREEKTDRGADYLILYIWGDDPIRSLYRSRWASNHPEYRKLLEWGLGFHNNFWSNIEMDLETGRFVEREQCLKTPEALYRMTDADWMRRALQDDLAVQLTVFTEGMIRDLDRRRISRLAECLEFKFDWSFQSRAASVPNPWPGEPAITPMQAQCAMLLDRYSLAATTAILDRANRFAAENRKTLLVLLFDPYRAMVQLKDEVPRYDQPIVDHLSKLNVNTFDMNQVHVNDFRSYSIDWKAYLKRYFIGHYNPLGQHFFAFAIKDWLVESLDPKPLPYQSRDRQQVTFESYLRGYAR